MVRSRRAEVQAGPADAAGHRARARSRTRPHGSCSTASAMRAGSVDRMGGEGSTVEIDETYWGTAPGQKVRRSYHHKEKIVYLVERRGKVRSFHMRKVNTATVWPTSRFSSAG